MDLVRSYAQILAGKMYDFCAKKAAQRKHKLITRMDIAFIVFLAVLAVFVMAQGQTGKTASTQSATARQQVARTSAVPAPGRGGVEITAGRGQSTVPGNNANNNATNNDWLTGANGALFTTNPQQTVANPKMVGLWNAMNGSVIAWMFFMFMITGYRVMGGAFGFKYAESLETLPHVVLAMAGSALSLFFMAFIISLENGLVQFILSSANGTVLAGRSFTEVVVPVNNWLTNIGLFMGALVVAALSAVLLALPGIGWLVGTVSAVAGTAAAGAFLALLQKFILTLLSIMLAVQLIMRMAMINIHIALGPWAIGLGSHWPELFQKWLKNTLALVFVQLLQVLCIVVSFVIFPKPNNSLASIITDPAGFIAPIAILWLTLRIPKMFGASTISIMSEAGQAAGGAVMTGMGAASSVAGGGQALASSAIQTRAIKKSSKAA